MRAFSRWFTRAGPGPDAPRAPIEVIVMCCFGVAWLVLFLIASALTRPHPGLHGDGLAVLLATVALLAAAATPRARGAMTARSGSASPRA